MLRRQRHITRAHFEMRTPTTPTTDAPAAPAATTANTSVSVASTTAFTSIVTTPSYHEVDGFSRYSAVVIVLLGDSGKVTATMNDYGVHAYDGPDFPTGCDSGVEMGEVKGDKEVIPPEHKGSSVGSHRRREDDPSASSSKRSRSDSAKPLADAGALFSPRGGYDSSPSGNVTSRTNPVRGPWMPTPSEIHSRYGCTAAPSLYALYGCSGITDD